MNDKTPRPMFQPAPRPRPLNDVGAASALKEATRDLGFGRPSSDAAPEPAAHGEASAMARIPAPASKPVVEAAPVKPVVAAPAPAPAPRAAAKPKAVKAEPEPLLDEAETSIKFKISEDLSTALKLDAVRRRVTLKYIVLEALADKGYPVDLANIPEDGRRAKK